MHKPFIHCFKTAKEYYVYDVNTDKIIQVSFETYNFLENNIWDEKAEREIEKLINEGYLKRTRVEEVKHFATDFLESYLENRMNQLVLQVTQKCNLRCSYCVYSGDYKNRNHSQKEMSWETAKEAVDYLYGHSMSSEDIYISFYGGEPLLMFRLIKEVVEYVKREYCQRTVHFNLTTNGTLFTPEIVQYFIKNNIQIMFSLDGPKEVHDKNRIFAGSNRGSFEKLRDSMKMIYSMGRKYYKKNVSFNTVLDPQNELRTIYEFLDKDRLISKNLSRISVLNDNYTDKQCEFSGEFVEEQEYEYFKCFLSKLKRINEKFVARAVKEEFDNEMREIKQHEEKMQEEISKVNHHSGPCIPGAKKIFVTAEGNIYPCERVSEISEVSKIGDIKKGIDKNKVLNLLNIERYSQDRCKDCWAYQHCTICIACADDTKNISNKEIEKHCWKVRGGFEEAMKNYCTLKELGYKNVAMALTDRSVSIDDEALMSEDKLAIILGTEGDGLCQETIDACDYTVKIPMAHGVDSLNVAAASAVAFWQLSKRK